MMGLSGQSEGTSLRKYSGGMKDVRIAKALVSGPRVLFLDEPTLGVDPGAPAALGATCAPCASGGPRWSSPRTTWKRPIHWRTGSAIMDEGRMSPGQRPARLEDSVSGARAMVIRAKHLSADVVEELENALRGGRRDRGRGRDSAPTRSTCSRWTTSCVPPASSSSSAHVKVPTLDDVLLELTGTGAAGTRSGELARKAESQGGGAGPAVGRRHCCAAAGPDASS